MKKLLTLCLLVMATMTLSAKTIKEFVVTTQPQMSCQNCENKIKKNLRFEKGVTNITTDLENQVVVVTYDADKTNEANLTNAFAKLDYKVAPTEKKAAAAGKTCPKSGKACSKADGKACAKDGKACSKEGKACAKDGKGEKKSCCKEGNGDKKCDGNGCKNGSGCCKNKEKK